MNKKGLLVVVSGPSGVGKGTVLKCYLAQNPDHVKVSVSATTRAPRPGEVDGEHYHFISRERFQEMIESGRMLEYAQYSGNYYGTPCDMVERELEAGNDIILEIEVQGALQVKRRRPDAVLLFVLPPSFEELSKRLVERHTESEEVIARRLNAAGAELAQVYRYDYALVNDDIDEAARKLGAILCAAKCSTAHMKEFIDEVQK